MEIIFCLNGFLQTSTCYSRKTKIHKNALFGAFYRLEESLAYTYLKMKLAILLSMVYGIVRSLKSRICTSHVVEKDAASCHTACRTLHYKPNFLVVLTSHMGCHRLAIEVLLFNPIRFFYIHNNKSTMILELITTSEEQLHWWENVIKSLTKGMV